MFRTASGRVRLRPGVCYQVAGSITVIALECVEKTEPVTDFMDGQ